MVYNIVLQAVFQPYYHSYYITNFA